MKIKYEFITGEVTEIEVEDSLGEVIMDSRRIESNADRKERYHCYSLDAAEYEGSEYGTEDTPESLFCGLENSREVYKAFRQLSEVQQRRLLMLAGGMSIREIARRENTNYKSVYESIEAGKSLKIYFEYTPSKPYRNLRMLKDTKKQSFRKR